MRPDLVIRGGTLVDGTGGPPRRGDIAIVGERIVTVGTEVGQGTRELDASGCIVTPGFVDVHTHYDGQATWDPLLAPSSVHGVTSVVMGNCGVGFAPVAPDRHDWLIATMEGVEDIPGTALHEGLSWGWESFPDYLDVLARRSRTIDVGAQVPHAALRAYVMGDDGADSNVQAGDAACAEMARLLGVALDAGAIGVATSRTAVHRTKDGEHLGTLHAARPELVRLAEVLCDRQKGVFQLVSDAYRSLDDAYVRAELDLIGDLARASSRPVSFTVQQSNAAPGRWREMLDAATRLRLEGLSVVGQVAPRPIGLLLGLEASTNPFTPCREYARIDRLPLGERVAAMRDPERRRRTLVTHAALTSGSGALPGLAFFGRFDDMYLLSDPVDYSLPTSSSVGAIARRTGRSASDSAYDALLAEDGHQLLYAPVFNFAERNLSAVREMVASSATIFGLSDAGAHCGSICDASMTTSYLALWGGARDDRARDGGGLGLAAVVRSLTRRPAEHVGWRDRGILAAGYLADCNVIDLGALACRPPRIVHDLPAGGRRLVQDASGYRFTVKRGEVTFVDGAHTGALPGELVRGVKNAPSNSARSRSGA